MPREKPFYSRFRADSTAPARPLVAYGLVRGGSRTSAVQVRCVSSELDARLQAVGERRGSRQVTDVDFFAPAAVTG
jgi:hypothetical protein